MTGPQVRVARMAEHFADRLSALTDERGPVCAGIDPRADALPPGLDAAAWGEETARLLGSRVATIKPQLAFFGDDWAQVERVARAGREGGALVIADCKRGDIDTTAQAYAERIAALGKANGILTQFHTLRRQDVEAGGSPTVQESLARLQG